MDTLGCPDKILNVFGRELATSDAGSYYAWHGLYLVAIWSCVDSYMGNESYNEDRLFAMTVYDERCPINLKICATGFPQCLDNMIKCNIQSNRKVTECLWK